MNKILVIGSTNIDDDCPRQTPAPPGREPSARRASCSPTAARANQAVAAARLGGDVACLVSGRRRRRRSPPAAVRRRRHQHRGPLTAKDTPDRYGTDLRLAGRRELHRRGSRCQSQPHVRGDRRRGGPHRRSRIPARTARNPDRNGGLRHRKRHMRQGTRVVLNPAPAMPLADELLRKVYLITPPTARKAKR